ncbi:hypothetical protein ZYGR_0N05940 [Zygosaccharomyces rouxii]|uniref:ZYRO0D13926p n=2 Tax=Zygosaccharomyces rouxii TaxID=4956 RepID=C5DWD5_ZYGRC|nr:uncharacterized protein ZYRO0D13926g [Zygosaccharomyces rouxii]KAH9201014.1 hypothetical protein LQ764DRAFT_224488 [Zygosaccharomyces rouxii]GAV49187.1 hypothetical protein ZYGR_0N05940 [Zygosaccharomyces rouxii]CAR28104.1 ZYRO0D13926p [Zygosaccharomyces rouxii]
MSAIDDDTKISRIIDDLVDIQELRPSSPPNIDDGTLLYQVLDQAPHGRKLMNYMTYSRPPSDIHGYNKGPTQKKTLVINQRWLDEEKRANTQITPATLQLETPVIFSWSKKAHDTKKDQTVKSQNDSTVRESTNNRLYKTVAARLDEIKSRENWDSKYSRPSTVNGTNASSPEKSEWANPNFKVDPLQPFVAKIVKEPKKKAPKKEKAPSKMKNLFSFLSNSNKKERSQSPDTKPAVHSSGPEPSQEIEASTDVDEQDQEQENKRTDDTIQEQVSPSTSVTVENTPTPTVPSAPPKLASTHDFNADSPLSMDSFIPLKPKKKN